MLIADDVPEGAGIPDEAEDMGIAGAVPLV